MMHWSICNAKNLGEANQTQGCQCFLHFSISLSCVPFVKCKSSGNVLSKRNPDLMSKASSAYKTSPCVSDVTASAMRYRMKTDAHPYSANSSGSAGSQPRLSKVAL